MRKANAKKRNMGAVIGYARVSTDGQSVHDQIVELKAAGASRTLAEKLSGAHSDRPRLRMAPAALDDGDTLMVVRLDRLARSTRDLLNILHEVGDKGASFKSLHDCWADTTTPHGRLMLTILGGLAEFEGRLIKARTDVGVKRAREQGIRFGRPKRAPSGSARQRVRRCRLGPL
jgi:DNA invertase Pin-like site-specific DNA recombinase